MKRFSIWILIFSFLAVAVYAYAPETRFVYGPSLFIQRIVSADSAYAHGNYRRAAVNYHNIVNRSPQKASAQIQFKYAYSLYKIGDYLLSAAQFDSLLRQDARYLPAYAAFFKVKALQKIGLPRAAEAGYNYILKYPKTSLADSLLMPVADYYYHKQNLTVAEGLYRKFIKWGVDRSQNVRAYARLVKILYSSNQKEQARKQTLYTMRKYPAAEETFDLVQFVKKTDRGFYRLHFFNVSDVYFANRHFQKLRAMLEQYIRDEKEPMLKQKARYRLVRIYFAQRKYGTALYGFNNMLKAVKDKGLEARIRLYLARIYLKKGLKQKAIRAYRDYAHRYPELRMASEAVWKAAWISEELRDLKQALENYHYLREKWPQSRYAREAYFREGFTYYRLGNVDFAENIFNTLRVRNAPDVEKNRAQYWAALCSASQGDSSRADSLRMELAVHLWDDYYTMKSYLLHKESVDTTEKIADELNKSNRAMLYYASGFASLMDKLKTAFDVKDVLGKSYALAALDDIKLYAKTKEEWIALAEIFKKFKAYGKAYRTYDYINRKFYAQIPFNQKPFILKERFPYYYDAEVNKYADINQVEPEFILAVMKQESVFNFKAHSWAQAYGLMQLIPKTAREMAKHKNITLSSNSQLFNPETNIRLGSFYLKKLLKQFDAKKELVLAAYNAGPHRAKRWRTLPGSEEMDVFIENIEFEETRGYVRKVMKNYWAYKLLRHNFQISPEDIQLGWNE